MKLRQAIHTVLLWLKVKLMALLDDVNSMIAAYEAKFAAAADVAKLEAQITDLTGQVTDLTARNTALQAQVDQTDAVVQAKLAELTPAPAAAPVAPAA